MTRSLNRLFSTVVAGVMLGMACCPASGAVLSVAGVVPDPADCTVAPRSAEEVLELLPAPEGGPLDPTTDPNAVVATAAANVFATVEADALAFATPPSDPADPVVATAIKATIHEFYACFNTGDPARWSALVTDDALRHFPEGQAGFMFVTTLLQAPTDPPEPNRRAGYAYVGPINRLANGRIGALVGTMRPPINGGAVRNDYWLFREERGRWLIDGVVLGLGGQPLFGQSTPTP